MEFVSEKFEATSAHIKPESKTIWHPNESHNNKNTEFSRKCDANSQTIDGDADSREIFVVLVSKRRIQIFKSNRKSRQWTEHR